ncbi:hypothetical protein SF123566_7642 [Shigella flexneri 1235-66]|nr:hypothetical protein SF123566_7642 [Shigella flexneri 1235-66]
MLLCQQGQGNVPYRYALAIACAADGDEMPIKSLSSMRDELRLVLCFTVTRLGALAD